MQRKANSQVIISYEYIRDRIIDFTLLPETALSDNQFAKELGMSRAPIREAILLLEMDGLVEINEMGRVHVSPIYFEDISDIFRVRFGLESEAIRLIAENGWLSETQKAELSSLQKQMKESSESDNFSDHYNFDDIFHRKLSEFSGSPRISDILDRMRLQMQRARWLNIANPGRQLAATAEHQAILEALNECDADTAVEKLKNHFDNSKASFSAILNDRKIQTFSLVIDHLASQKNLMKRRISK